MAKPLNLTEEDFDREVKQAEGFVVVDFWSQTCPPCLQLNPQYEAACGANSDKVKFCKVAVQDALPLFQVCGIRGTPTMLLFNNGEEISRELGYMSADAIADWLNKHI